jgi:hypothetical protein
MILFLWLVPSSILALVLLLWWSLRGKPGQRAAPRQVEERATSHVQYIPQVQQAFSSEDYHFLLRRGGPNLARGTERERRKVATAFLVALRGEFKQLLRLARVIAALSPEVAPLQEAERLRLAIAFECRWQLMRAEVRLGATPLRELRGLSDAVSRLSVQMETAMKELGERAALATEMMSAVEGRDVHLS